MTGTPDCRSFRRRFSPGSLSLFDALARRPFPPRSATIVRRWPHDGSLLPAVSAPCPNHSSRRTVRGATGHRLASRLAMPLKMAMLRQRLRIGLPASHKAELRASQRANFRPLPGADFELNCRANPQSAPPRKPHRAVRTRLMRSSPGARPTACAPGMFGSTAPMLSASSRRKLYPG